ncbi:unnamed protein product [Medioppia subpectinata]|uniref:Cytochrome P450 n=1 Tax=Medioppia subpectinata TaxID=1979941 RepID=A0A7R9KGD3_9ACAR|nr:unnamed protein product [Medioppia subpectinata]CAG2102874.1 unnamed protein product [Medioppia subpectinata]
MEHRVLMAATESMATTLTNCIQCLAQHPDIQKRAYHEVSAKIGCQHRINWETLRELHYTEAFIKETLRLNTPFPRFERVVKRDFQLCTDMYGPVLLPKGSIVSVLAVVVHTDPDYFPEPMIFNPDRFLPGHQHLITPKAFMPFANGPRMKSAFFQLKHLLAHLLLNYRIEYIDQTGNESTKDTLRNIAVYNIKFIKHCNINNNCGEKCTEVKCAPDSIMNHFEDKAT